MQKSRDQCHVIRYQQLFISSQFINNNINKSKHQIHVTIMCNVSLSVLAVEKTLPRLGSHGTRATDLSFSGRTLNRSTNQKKVVIDTLSKKHYGKHFYHILLLFIKSPFASLKFVNQTLCQDKTVRKLYNYRNQINNIDILTFL